MGLYRFSWFIENEVAAMAMPDGHEEDFEELKRLGISALVTLTEEPVLAKAAREHGFEYLHVPIPDFYPPLLSQIRQFVNFCDRNIQSNRAVAVHCVAGMGRTGTMLACYLVSRGTDPWQAIETVREKRPGSIENVSQEGAVFAFADRHRDAWE